MTYRVLEWDHRLGQIELEEQIPNKNIKQEEEENADINDTILWLVFFPCYSPSLSAKVQLLSTDS